MGQIIAAVFPVCKGELQHLHAGITCFPQQLPHRVSQIAQVFRDNVFLPQGLLYCAKKVDTGPLAPLAVPRSGVFGRDGIISIEASKMVDAQSIIQAELKRDAAQPPGIALPFHPFPIEQRVAPQLTVGGKGIRRTAGHRLRAAILVQLKLLRSGPYVGTVSCHVDGQITDQCDPATVGILFQGIPLPEKEVLYTAPEFDFGGQLLPGVFKGRRMPQALLLRPLLPGHTAVAAFQRHKQRVVRQPLGIFPGKLSHPLPFPCP